MRDYSKVTATFWTGKTGKALKAHSPEALIVAMYLMTSPHSNMLGLFYQPMLYITHETGLGLEGASKGLKGAIEAGFCGYDEDSEMVWVYEMAFFQIAAELKPSDNRCLGVQKEYLSLPQNRFLPEFFVKYSKPFCMAEARGLKAPPKPRTGTGARAGAKTVAGNGELRFSDFWQAYPKKVGKDAALKQFENRKVDDELLAQMLAALAIQKPSPGWQKDGGQFIPNPATWLSQGRWQDEAVASANDDPYGLRTAVNA